MFLEYECVLITDEMAGEKLGIGCVLGSALRSWRQEDWVFRAITNNIARLSQNKREGKKDDLVEKQEQDRQSTN